MDESVRQVAQANAAEKFDADITGITHYVAAAGGIGDQNADVLGRLLVHLHAEVEDAREQLDAQRAVIDALSEQVETLTNVVL